MGPKSNAQCPYKKKRHIGTQREEDHVKTKEEMGVMLPQAKGLQEAPEAGRARKDPVETSQAAWPC